ncbi:MAG: RICIN domain-containing protein, partial [Clostridia bacterium]|nr:RICIN domain-containing protein [Clostridia bacterium]
AHDVAYTVTALDNGNYLLAATLPRTSGGNYTMSITSYYDYIQDATIYNAYNTNAFGQSANLWVGYVSDMGVERVLIRPNNWTFTQDAYPNRTIQSASVVIRDITVTTPQETIACHPFTGNNWEENTATWSTVQGDSIGSLIDFNAVSSSIGASSPTGYYYYFDVTDYVQDWYDGDTSWTKGFAFRWVQESNPFVMEKCFASTQYSTERYRPRIEITETLDTVIQDGVYRIKKTSETEDLYLTSGPTITSGTDVNLQGKLPDSSYNQLWRISSFQNGCYTIRPMHYTPAALRFEGASDVDIAYANTTDSYNETNASVISRIVPNADGHRIMSFDLSCTAVHNNVNNNVDSLEAMSGTPSSADWTFELVEDPPCEVLFYDPSTGTRVTNPVSTYYVGEQASIGALNVCGYRVSMSMPGNIDPLHYSWWSTDSSVVEFPVPGVVKVRSIGTVSLYVEWLDLDNNYCNASIVLNCYPIRDGDYFIRNVKTDKYADIKDQVMANGTLIHQWDFHGHWTQEWTFERYSGYYYTIKSTVSGTPYYMSTDGSTVKLKSNANGITDDMLWYLSYSDYGNMKIAPKARHSQNYVMAVAWDGTNQEQNGLSFIEQLYSDDAYDTDEWEVYVPYTIHVNVMMDQGYIAKRENNHISIVTGYMEFLRTLYWNNFSILVKYSLSTFTSLADTCDPNREGFCNCDPSQSCQNSAVTGNGDGEHTYHHTNVYNNLAQIDLPDGSHEYTLVLFGHDLCEMSGGQHISNDAAGQSMILQRLAYVEYQSNNLTYERCALVHEVGHWFGAPDHYGKDETDKIDTIDEVSALYKDRGLVFSQECIYGRYWDLSSSIADDVEENCTICPGCSALMAVGE